MDGCNALSFNRQLLERLPLAEAQLRILGHAWDDSWLEQFFQTHRGRCYTDKIAFGVLVGVVRDALLRHDGSANQSIAEARRDGRLEADRSSVYQKLSRLPIELSTAFLRESTRRLRPLPPDGRPELPPCLRGFEVIAIDGKTLKKATRRLKALRGLRGRMLGGKLLVALSLTCGMAVAMAANPNAFRNDMALCDDLLRQLPLIISGTALFIADRQFCDLKLMERLVERGDHFLIRCPRNIRFQADADPPAREGVDADGRRWIDQQGWLGAAGNKKRRRVRRIALFRPGEDDVILATDLTDEKLYPAGQLLDAYLARWGIERMFQQVTETFSLQQLIGGHPRAMIFQAAFCLTLYNVTQVIKAHVADGAGKKQSEVSTRKLFDDATDELIAWATAGDVSPTLELLGGPMASDALRRRLGELLGAAWTDWWEKCPTRPRRPPGPTQRVKGGRASVWLLIQEYERRKKHVASRS